MNKVNCNGNHHLPNCQCNFRGGNHGERLHWNDLWQANLPRSEWSKGADEFCRKSKCPKCAAEVYFVRHNGGSVWFDDLDGEWPKHGCFITDNMPVKATKFNTSVAIVDVDKATTAALLMRGRLEAIWSYRPVTHTPEAQEMLKAASAAGRADGHRLIQQAQAVKAAQKAFCHIAFRSMERFDAEVCRLSNRSNNMPLIQPMVVILRANGTVSKQFHDNDKEAANDYRARRSSANRGAVLDSGLAFAVIYSTGAKKVYLAVEPVADPVTPHI